jgi:hypothetical protein
MAEKTLSGDDVSGAVGSQTNNIAGAVEYVNLSITNPDGASVTVDDTTHTRRIVLYYTDTYARLAAFF